MILQGNNHTNPEFGTIYKSSGLISLQSKCHRIKRERWCLLKRDLRRLTFKYHLSGLILNGFLAPKSTAKKKTSGDNW
jgi:hypothetical protein